MLFLFYIQYTHPFTDELPKKKTFLAPAIHGILHGHVWQTPQPRSEWRPQSAATQVSSTRFLADQRGAFHLQGGLKWIQHDSTWFNQWLVGGFTHLLYFPYYMDIYGIILPIDFHIFRGVGQPPDQKTVGIWCRNCATSQIWSMRGCETNCQVGFRPWRDSNSSEIPDIEMEQALFGFESATKIQVWEVEL